MRDRVLRAGAVITLLSICSISAGSSPPAGSSRCTPIAYLAGTSLDARHRNRNPARRVEEIRTALVPCVCRRISECCPTRARRAVQSITFNSADQTVLGIATSSIAGIAGTRRRPHSRRVPRGRVRVRRPNACGCSILQPTAAFHRRPDATVITAPLADEEVPVSDLLVRWSPVPGVAQYLLEIENESTDPEQSLTINLPPVGDQLPCTGGMVDARNSKTRWSCHGSRQLQCRLRGEHFRTDE